MKKKKFNHCSWCGKPTIMGPMILADTPLLEFMEDKIDEHGREQIWGDKSDWSKLDLDSDFEAELLVYDNMLSTVSNKVVCISCLKEDEELYNKYYERGDGDEEIVFDSDY